MSPLAEELEFRVEWEHALAALELDVEHAERLLQSIHAGADEELPRALGSWTPPASIGTLPESLVDRAQVVLARQLAVIEDVASAAIRSRQHLEVQRRMRPDDATSRPLFVDASF
jgi:hypothetical protein